MMVLAFMGYSDFVPSKYLNLKVKIKNLKS